MDTNENVKKLLRYFFGLLEKKDYSKKELEQKGLKKGYSQEDVVEVINTLVEKKFVDEERMAENIVYFYGSSKGKLWIQNKLSQKGIPKEIILKHLSGITPDLKKLASAIKQKYKITDPNSIDNKLKNKILYFLQSRGYTDIYNLYDKIIYQINA